MTWSLRRKLVISFLAVILPQAGALSLVSYLYVRELVKIHEQLGEVSHSLQATGRLDRAVNDMTISIHGYIIGRDVAEPARFQRLAKVVNQSLQGCRSLSCHVNTQKPQEMADLIEPKVREMEKISQQIFTLRTPIDHPNSQVLVNRAHALSTSLSSQVERMWGDLQGKVESLWERAVEVRTRTQRLLAFYTAVAVSVTVLVALYLSWRLTVPLHQLRRGIQKVFEGDLGHSVAVKSRDEVGELASSFNYMVRRLREAQVSQEEYSRRLEEEVERKTGELQEEAEISAALVRVGREMISMLDTPLILDRLCRLITEVLECECSHTLLRRPEEEAYVPVAGWGSTPEQWETLRVLKIPCKVISGLLTRLEREEVVEVITSDPQDLLPAVLPGQFGVTVSLWVALRRGEEIIGVQTAAYRGRTEPFTTRQQRIARGIAQIASMALENARLLEQANSASRLKSDFLATVSHELRTPLNIIMGYNGLLLEEVFGSLTKEQAYSLRRLGKSARELLELINATLDVSRLDAGRLPVDLKEVCASELIEEVKAETQDLREGVGLEFEWKVMPGLPSLYTDLTKLKIVLKNLISNAVKFTEEGSVTVSVHPQGEGVEFCVTDTGIGIAPEALPIIFEPFRQVEDPLTRRHGGVGLGLYIVRRLLELLGGTITVESEVGRGSTFRVWVPASENA